MTEQKKQLKKMQLYQDIDLLEKDFLRAYPLSPQTGVPIGVIAPVLRWIYIILIIFFILCLLGAYVQKNENKQIEAIISAIMVLAIMITLKVVTDKKAPRYAKYQTDKAAYDQRHAELRRQYDAL